MLFPSCPSFVYIAAVACLLFALDPTVTVGFSYRYKTGFSGRLSAISNRKICSTSMDAATATLADDVRKWVFRNIQSRAEVTVSGGASKTEIISELMKSILVSYKILEGDVDLETYLLAVTFPGISSDHNLGDLESTMNEILETMNPATGLFPAPVQHTLKFYQTNVGEQVTILLLNSMRASPRALDFSDIADIPEKFDEQMYDNTIDAFPFPSVYDFISEVNRPPDANTMNNLRYNFVLQDFKYDLKKMSKKKNPQEMLDTINCKLTRLQNWKDVLLVHSTNTANPFTDIYDWSEEVKGKFRTMKYLALKDPKRALETQYDRRKVFIKLIDQWSDRLKRNFKYIYQSQRREVRFEEILQRSPFRNELVNLTRLYGEVPYLAIEGPDFQPGAPLMPPTVRKDRMHLANPHFLMEDVVLDTSLWVDRINQVQNYAFPAASAATDVADGKAASALQLPTDSIERYVFSRGYATERLLFDVWQALNAWTRQADELLEGGVSTAASQNGVQDKVNHHDAFLETLAALNNMSRAESVANGVAVKDLFAGWNATATGIADWCISAVAELNLDDEMDRVALEGNATWSEELTEVMTGATSSEDAYSSAEVERREKNEELWLREYKPFLQRVETVKTMLPWWRKETRPDSPRSTCKNMVGAWMEEHDFSAELLSVPTLLTHGAPTEGRSMLFVMPRMYRDIGEEELGSFLEFCKMVLGQLKHLPIDGGVGLIPLHPQMVNQKGSPDYSRRCPHPAILFYRTE